MPGSAPADGADATASSANQAVSGADATSANTTDAAANTSSGGEATSSATETGDVAATDQAMGTAADAGTEAAPPVEGPTFDIIRVEPSGEAVIAGLAAPRAKVEILNRDEPVATAEANERGEWALELSEPLPPGTHDLAIRATSEDGSEVTHSHQRVAVSVPQSSDEEPLVVLNQPDAPSRIVQVPAEGDDEQQVAADARSGADAAAGMPDATMETTGSSPDAGTEVAAAPQDDQMSAPAGESASAEPSTDSQAAAGAASASDAMAANETTEPPTGAEATAGEMPSSGSSSTTGMASAEASSQVMAEAEAGMAEPSQPAASGEKEPEVTGAPAPVTPEVGVAAVEAETDGTLYIAGTATTREPVRVYIDEEFVGETNPTAGGTWLLETNREMPPAEYTIRADQVGAGDVVARAEVPFKREVEVASLRHVGESMDPGTAEVAGTISDPAKVVIKRGDNLWRISRELYGHGVRYSTIYQANSDQIRNPHLIYPGQVFVMPTGDTAWDAQ